MCTSFRPKPSLIITLVVINIGVSILTSALMFILTYPGDECLLFASVRGHALIYGNPVGCNYISYGHCFLVAFAIFLLGYVFCSKKSREESSVVGPHIRSTYPKLSSSFTLGFTLFIFMFSLLMSAVSLAGYLTSCNELHYEAKNQLYARLTLGNPYRFLSISCNSLFSEDDFHNRFHHDHYEYSGMFYGQNRGYKHGRVHKMVKDHYHLLPLEIALEGGLAASFFSWFIWLLISLFMFLSRRKSFEPLHQHVYANHNDMTQFTEVPFPGEEHLYHQQTQQLHPQMMMPSPQPDPSVMIHQGQFQYPIHEQVEWTQPQSIIHQTPLMYAPSQVPLGPPPPPTSSSHFQERNQTPLSMTTSSSSATQQSEIIENMNLFNYAGIKCSQL